MPSILLLIAAVAMAIASVRARDRCLLLVSIGSLMCANPMSFVTDGLGWLEWSLLTAAPIAGSTLMVAAACLALGRGGHRAIAAVQASRARPAAHVLIRSVTVMLIAAITAVAATLAPSLWEAAPEALSYTAAALILLAVWALWPMVAGWDVPTRRDT